ncbi:two-component response regulator ARR2-like [Punica granatum]|uniref:Uncharacterized protein n=2 Tax=Punica granatum TaxID=22663 RepID=A0A2I0KCP5_PUNGR|nr:two-component response regulator ARR2-like [Punica granatum]PKI66294.1 hypothetical protein CRG98_013320 [Punica granatum]
MNGDHKGTLISEAGSKSDPASVAIGDNDLPSNLVVLKLLVLDDDEGHLHVLRKMLEECQYEVISCTQVESALEKLRQNKDVFDLLLSNDIVSGMDGFNLLRDISMEFDIPVIIMSGDDRRTRIIKSIEHGFCACLVKPIQKKALMDIWKHVIQKRKCKFKDLVRVRGPENRNSPEPNFDHAHKSPKNSKRKNNGGDSSEHEQNDAILTPMKKQRVVWDSALHDQFVSAVTYLGINEAVPKKILELMNVPGLTRENVASHLQKYRQHQKKKAQESLESTFGPMSSDGNLDLHELIGHENWKINMSERHQRRQMMKHKESHQYQYLQTSQNMNMHVEMAPSYQTTQPMMSGNSGNPIVSSGVAEANFPYGCNTIEMGREEAYHPVLQTPSSFEFPIYSHLENQLYGLPFVHDFSQIGLQDWELNFQHENIIPDQPHEDTIPREGTINLDMQRNIPSGDNAVRMKSETFPGTNLQPFPARFGLEDPNSPAS